MTLLCYEKLPEDEDEEEMLRPAELVELQPGGFKCTTDMPWDAKKRNVTHSHTHGAPLPPHARPSAEPR